MKLRILKIHSGDNKEEVVNKSISSTSNNMYTPYSYGLHNTDTIKSNRKKRIYTSWRGACSFCYTRDSLKMNAEFSRSALEKKNTRYKRKRGFGRWVDKDTWSKFGSSAFYKDIDNNIFYNRGKK